jgi:hypothetical protein
VVMQLFSKNEFVSLKRIKNHLLQKTTRWHFKTSALENFTRIGV